MKPLLCSPYSTPKESKFHAKVVTGVEVSYDYDSNYWQDSQKTPHKGIMMLSGGFGVEYGEHRSGSILFGMDFLYMLRATTAQAYYLTPSAAIYALYNF